MQESKYTNSVLMNLKWAIKRIIRVPKCDKYIDLMIKNFIPENNISLNIGCGLWTPYDKSIRAKAKKVTNLDATFVGTFLHPRTGLKMVINEKNIYELLEKEKTSVIYCFHTLTCLNLNLPKLLNYCSDHNIIFACDLNFSENDPEVVSKYFSGNGMEKLLQTISRLNSKAIIFNSTDQYLNLINIENIDDNTRYLLIVK